MIKHSFIATLLGATLAFGGAAFASPITYNVSQTIGGGSVTGTLQTDGTIGALTGASFLGWNLNLLGTGGSTSLNLNNSNSTLSLGGNGVTATANDLSFNFSSGAGSYLLVQQGPQDGNTFFCDAADGTASTPCNQGGNDVPVNYTDPSSQFEGEQGTQVIATAAVPEPLTLSIFGAGILGAAGLRRRNKKNA